MVTYKVQYSVPKLRNFIQTCTCNTMPSVSRALSYSHAVFLLVGEVSTPTKIVAAPPPPPSSRIVVVVVATVTRFDGAVDIDADAMKALKTTLNRYCNGIGIDIVD